MIDDWLIDWLIERLIARLVYCLIYLTFVRWLVWLNKWLIDWLIGWLTIWLVDEFIDWLGWRLSRMSTAGPHLHSSQSRYSVSRKKPVFSLLYSAVLCSKYQQKLLRDNFFSRNIHMEHIHLVHYYRTHCELYKSIKGKQVKLGALRIILTMLICH